MKVLKIAVFVVCVATTLSVQAQKKTKEKTVFIPPVIVKDVENTRGAESKKQAYKSKQWKQGNVNMPETNTGEGKIKSEMEKRPNRPGKVPQPPPPPPAPPVEKPTRNS